jgi:CheY-like chemotaxis protein
MKRLLVVDEDDRVRESTCSILEEEGFSAVAVSDGARVLESITADKPDLVLLDLAMPGLGGWSVLDDVAALPDPPEVILLSGGFDSDALARGERKGVAAFVPKPIHRSHLVAACRKALKAARRGRPGSPADRRQEERQALMVGVRVAAMPEAPARLGELLDLSRSGARVVLVSAFEAAERVKVVIDPGRSVAPLGFEAVVRWCSPGPEGVAHGLEFVDLTPDAEARIRSLLI